MHPTGRHHPGQERLLIIVTKAAVAGAIAVWLMDRFDWLVFARENPRARQRTEHVRPTGMDPAHALADKAAAAIGKQLGPAPPHRHPLGLAVHYAIPMGLAVVYRIVKRKLPVVGRAGGALYGAAIFLILDELINPKLGLAAYPKAYPWQRHARELFTHIIFGLALNRTLDFLDRQSGIKPKPSF